MEIIRYFIHPILLVLLVLGVTFLENYYMKKRNFKVHALANYAVMSGISVILYIIGGFTLWTVKGIAIAFVLLYASVQDFSVREADDFLWVMLVLLSLVNFAETGIASMLIGGFAVFVPQMVIANTVKTGGIGGADIKISTAGVLSLGFFGGVIGYMAGLVFAVIFQTIYSKIKNQSCKNGFPLLPFLSAGLMLGYVI